MAIVRKLLAAIFAILFIITAILALFFFNMDRRAFSADTYQQVFANDGFYNRLPTVLAEALATSTSGQSGFPLVIHGLTAQNWEAFLRAVLPQEVLKVMGDEALASIFAYLNDQNDTAQLSLAPLKASLSSEAGVQAVYTLLNSQPDCTFSQIAEMTLSILQQQQQQIQFCKPSDDLKSLVTPVIQFQLQTTAALLPDQITIASVDNNPGQTDPRQRLKVVRLVLRLSPILPLGLLLMITLLAVRSLKSWLTWWGVPFTITGGVAAMMGLSGAPVAKVILQEILVNNMPTYLPVMMLDYASELSAAMVRQLLEPVVQQGLVIALLGFAMILLAILYSRWKARIAKDTA